MGSTSEKPRRLQRPLVSNTATSGHSHSRWSALEVVGASRSLDTMRQVASVLWPKLRVLQVFGANTGVGKTIFSTILCRAFEKQLPRIRYLKPVSTGPLDEADDSLVVANNRSNQDRKGHISSYGNSIQSRCLYQFDEPVSPHIAVRSSKEPPSDETLLSATYDELQSYANGKNGIAIVETAGGVLSPAPSGRLQADVYRPLRMPVMLIGDHRLGGIGTTISAWESLHVRGYDVQAVALFRESRYDNFSYLKDYFAERDTQTLGVAPPPEAKADSKDEEVSMQKYYREASGESDVVGFTARFVRDHDHRIQSLQEMPAAADRVIWHPFMQHRERSKDTILAMDSAHGDYFQTYARSHMAGSSGPADSAVLRPAFDASASWWTQGLGHGNPQLALTAAHAAGRYGHVMFAGAVHEPALKLAQTLVERMGNERLKRVFYTDNGSTGMEVAVKMALRAASNRYGWSAEDEIVILGLKNSYHGDTIGTMDCSEPSLFNKKVEWYRGRGHWLDFPQVKMRQGQWIVEHPEELKGMFGPNRTFDHIDQIFDWTARTEDRQLYRRYFDDELVHLRKAGKKLGALIMEPVLLGAGGMMFADPLYQRCLVEAVREADPDSVNRGLDWQGMPVVFDEVFTGLYRLGDFSAASFLDVNPDIVVNAKLLTGGLLPLCTTTASEAIFEAFLSSEKSDALLHGHSYTAHAVGCAVANQSLDIMAEIEKSSSARKTFQASWRQNPSSASASLHHEFWSMWSQEFLVSTSRMAQVDSAFAVGSVFAMSLKDPAGSGYASTAAVGLRDRLFTGAAGEEWVIHSRVLGNVLYLMAAVTSTPATLRGIEERVVRALKDM